MTFLAVAVQIAAVATRPAEGPHFHTPSFYDSIVMNPIFLGALGVSIGVGIVVTLIAAVLFKFLRKKIAEEIIGLPAPGGPDDPRVIGKCPWPCQAHSQIVAALAAQGTELVEVEDRQKVLREETLPERYVRNKDLLGCKAEQDKCQGDRKENERNLFSRVSQLEKSVGILSPPNTQKM